MIATLSRAAAIVIIIAGVIDPAWSASRSITPAVAVIDDRTPASQPLADRAATALARWYTIARRETIDTAAVVVAGRDLPRGAETTTVPAFAVTPSGADVRIAALDLPARGHVHARVPADVRLRVWHARGRSLSISLAANGVVVDTATRPVTTDDATIDVPLTLTPAATGLVGVRITASIAGGAASDVHVDSLVRIDDRPWTVLVFDRRPSWMSTFVRRAIEADPRFAVTSRTTTSVGVSTDTPGAPATLTDASALAKFDAIVVGAPDALSPVDVASIDAFLRRRGGSAVLLWDAPPAGPAAALAGVTKWTSESLAADAPVDTVYGALRASEVARPGTAGAQVLALAPATANGPPVIWSAPIGAGRVIVNGALDSWRYRTADNAAFDRVWGAIVADAADRAPAPLTVSASARVAKPADRVAITIRARDAAGEYVDSAIPTVRASARVVDATGKTLAPLRVWPGDTPGLYRAELIAPDHPGDVRVVASIALDRPGANPIEADTDVRIARDATRTSDADAVQAWTSARGGAVFDDAHLADLANALHRVVESKITVEKTHPMRSPWWILPVTLFTGLEWWRRRRNGRP